MSFCSAHLIEDIKIIENNKEKSKPTSSTVVVSKPVPKRAQRPVSENITYFNPGPSLNNPPKPAAKLLLKSESPRKTLSETEMFQSALCKCCNLVIERIFSGPRLSTFSVKKPYLRPTIQGVHKLSFLTF